MPQHRISHFLYRLTLLLCGIVFVAACAAVGSGIGNFISSVVRESRTPRHHTPSKILRAHQRVIDEHVLAREVTGCVRGAHANQLAADFGRRRCESLVSPITAHLVEERHMSISAWSHRHVRPLHIKRVYAPFGGPDLYTLLALFDEAETIVLVGMESGGTSRCPSVWDASGGHYRGMNHSQLATVMLEDLIRGGFFNSVVFQKVANQIAADACGVYPLLLCTLALIRHRTEHTSDGQRYALSSIEWPAETRRNASAPRDVQWGWDRQLRCTVSLEMNDTVTTGRTVRICYAATDLSTPAAAEAAAHFLSAAPTAVLLKASLFAIRDARFASLADAILDHASLVLQDESGFKWSQLQRSPPPIISGLSASKVTSKAHVVLFGSYSREAAFRGAGAPLVDEELLNAFQRGRERPQSLPFPFGYGSMLVQAIFVDRLIPGAVLRRERGGPR